VGAGAAGLTGAGASGMAKRRCGASTNAWRPHAATPGAAGEKERRERESEKREHSFFSYAIDEVSRHSCPQVRQPQIEDWAVGIFFADVDGAAGPGCYQLFNMEMSV
jgi:hypothetical protein